MLSNNIQYQINLIFQNGGGYPGSVGCNDLIPHAKWHVQSAAALADVARLADFLVKIERNHVKM